MAEFNFSRRNFFRAGFFLAASAGCLRGRHSLEHAGHNEPEEAQSTLIDLHRFSSDPTDVVTTFDHASTALLIAAYSNFFPQFMGARNAWEAPEDLARAAEKIVNPINPHRLYALPAVAAAHAIPFTPQAFQEELWERIAQTLINPNREVREIVLQNLVTASLPSPEGIVRWDVNDLVLSRVVQVIKEAEHLPQLISPASMALAFLLNTRATLSHNGMPLAKKKASHIDQLITQTLSSRAEHFVYLRRLKASHEKDFAAYDPHVVTSLPSHHTEMILQSGGARKNTPNYNLDLALIHARLTFEVWRTAFGLAGKADEVMTQNQAAHAFPKLVEFEAVAGMQGYFRAWQKLPLPKSERPFQSFVSDDLVPRLDKFGAEFNADCRKMAAMRRLPKALPAYRWQSIADSIGPSRVENIGSVLLETLALLGIHLAASSIERTGHKDALPPEAIARGAFNLPNEPQGEEQSVREQAAQEALKIDKECGEAMDELERQIGPATVLSDSR